MNGALIARFSDKPSFQFPFISWPRGQVSRPETSRMATWNDWPLVCVEIPISPWSSGPSISSHFCIVFSVRNGTMHVDHVSKTITRPSQDHHQKQSFERSFPQTQVMAWDIPDLLPKIWIASEERRLPSQNTLRCGISSSRTATPSPSHYKNKCSAIVWYMHNNLTAPVVVREKRSRVHTCSTVCKPATRTTTHSKNDMACWLARGGVGWAHAF